MASVDSEEVSDQESNRYGSYHSSADVSESDSPLSSSHCSLFGDGNPIWVVPQKANLHSDLSDVEMMKERFAKLILGEDMSGGGKGVCSALAISNAITNLSATVFGELWRLEPLALQKKTMWRREMDWLLCVCNSIVELVPSIRQFPSGNGTYEVMTTRPRADLNMNLPALKKLDAMLIGILDGFHETEFWYGDRGFLHEEGDNSNYGAYSSTSPGRRSSIRQDEKWWLPCLNVPPKGLSEEGRKKIQQYRDCTNQIFKAALAINSNVLTEMEISNAYLDALPKGGKACVGEIIYQYITAELYSPECLLDRLDLSSELKTLEIANRIEAAVHVWKLKGRNKHSNNQKSKHMPWGGKVKGLAGDDEKNHILAQRAEMLLRSLKIRFPSLAQTALDMHKIQYNTDVGQSILESYSRVMESLAFNIMARIDDVLFADDAAKQSAATESSPFFNSGCLGGLPVQKRISISPFSVRDTPYASSFSTAPTFDVSPPLSGSPEKGMQVHEQEKPMPIDLDKLWSAYAGNFSSRRISVDPPERNNQSRFICFSSV